MILSCCKDLIFSTKIRSTAEHIGVPFRGAATVQAVLDRLNRVADGRLNEPVTGVLVDLEMGDAALAIIEAIKTHAAGSGETGQTQGSGGAGNASGGAGCVNIPVIAFGSHVAVEVLAQARAKGADAVMPRSQFVVQLPELLKKYGGVVL